MAKRDITILKSETAAKIIAKLGKSSGTTGTLGRSGTSKGPQSRNLKQVQQQLIRIVSEHDDKNGYYNIDFVNRNMDADDAKDHKWDPTDQTDELLGLEVSGTAGLTRDGEKKKAYMAYPIVSSDSSIVWVFSVGGAPRPWVEITSKTGTGEYLGNVKTSPNGEVSTEGAIIKVADIYSIDFPVGYGDYAESATEEIEGESETVYYLPSVQMSSAYAKITAVTDHGTYTADIYSALSPEPAYTEQTVIIPGATANALPVGYEGVVTRSGAGWIMDGFLLG